MGKAVTAQPTFLMTDPAHYQVAYAINPWMKPGVWGADPGSHQHAATAGWRALRNALEAAGGQVRTIPGAPGQPDMVFPANAAVVLDGKALLAHFRHPERQGEEAPLRAAFEDLRRHGLLTDVAAIDGCFHEGAGDAIWDAARGHFWVGSGPRSSLEAADQIERFFGRPVVRLPLATERYYHLDTCFCPLSGGEILYYPPALSGAALTALYANTHPDQRIEADDEDAEAFCVNAVCLGRTIVMAEPAPRLRARLTERGYRVIGVNLAEFILSGGGAFCMTLRLDLASVPARASAPELVNL
jgi:N-dimethylarginine dimethylaminohydrolase